MGTVDSRKGAGIAELVAAALLLSPVVYLGGALVYAGVKDQPRYEHQQRVMAQQEAAREERQRVENQRWLEARGACPVAVRSYVRSDGTYVSGHCRGN